MTSVWSGKGTSRRIENTQRGSRMKTLVRRTIKLLTVVCPIWVLLVGGHQVFCDDGERSRKGQRRVISSHKGREIKDKKGKTSKDGKKQSKKDGKKQSSNGGKGGGSGGKGDNV